MESVADRFFSPDEVERLKSGLPRLDRWGRHLLVPFQARQLRRACPLWINRRWFLERGINVTEADVEQRVSNWLIAEFGYTVPLKEDPVGAFTNKVKTFYADRYGSTSGKSVHGGSGRVATVGCFQAKGIGVTPLTGIGANWVHSHGCISMEEAVREVIYAELAAAEFPHGAVPVIALVGTDLHIRAQPPEVRSDQLVQRALIVRPAALRLAHAERAPMFNHSVVGYCNSQLDDVQRTKDVVQQWWARSQTGDCQVDGLPDLSDLACRIAEQIAFGQVHRLFNGGYFSSNLSVTGALLDFGGMRSLPNWANARTLDQVVGFGDEMKVLTKVMQSLVFHFNKYRSRLTKPLDATTLISCSNQAHARAFYAECLRIFNLDASQDSALREAIVGLISRYFSEQQILRVNYKHGQVRAQGWLFDALVCATESKHEMSAAMCALRAIQATLQRHFAALSWGDRRALLAWSSAVRYLMPREAIDRERLQQRIESLLSANGVWSKAAQRAINDFIQRAVGQSRRHWWRLPRNLLVDAHVTCEGSSALVCSDPLEEQAVLWVEGLQYGSELHLFGSPVPWVEAEEGSVNYHGAYWTARVAVRTHVDASLRCVTQLNGCSIELPAMQIRYPRPFSWAVTAA